MGPFPHDAPPPVISAENPAGTDGFEFVEFAHPDPAELDTLFKRMGFAHVASHKSRNIKIYRQGDVNYILNAEPTSFGHRFIDQHGPCAPSMAWRVVDAKHAFDHAVSKGAIPYTEADGVKTIDAPAIVGIGGSLVYFLDHYGAKGSPYTAEFNWVGEIDPKPTGAGIEYLDHLTNNVFRGNMDKWFAFYQGLFNFRQIRFFEIEGKYTALISRALTSPCNKIRIPINESIDDKSQIEEYLKKYNGEGIQHIACGCTDAYESVKKLSDNGLHFMPAPPNTYYEQIDDRLPGHGESIEHLKENGLLLDGEVLEGDKPRLLLQIFSKTVIGPIFFEFIQRKGDEGFGEGNFRALFASIEEDQIRRGVLQTGKA
jgi:4-hydroxyphenylpyruvate dioxygenase